MKEGKENSWGEKVVGGFVYSGGNLDGHETSFVTKRYTEAELFRHLS